jgi:hypothetical protein
MSRLTVTSVQDRAPSRKYIAESTFKIDINDIDYHLQVITFQTESKLTALKGLLSHVQKNGLMKSRRRFTLLTLLLMDDQQRYNQIRP